MKHIVLTWVDTSGDGVGLATDILHGAIYNVSKNIAIPIPPSIARSVETQSVEVPDTWAAVDVVHIWGAWRRADGLDASETMYALST